MSKMKQPKISVIVPIYKVEKYLVQCIDSILNQTLEDIEVILVDDGDRDACRFIIDHYEQNDKRVKAIHEKNGGYGASVNKGMEIAVGEYISIIESDDFIEPTMYEEMYKKAQKFDADIVKTPYYEYYSENLPSPHIIICPWIQNFNAVPQDKLISVLDYPCFMGTHPSIWSAIYKRSYLDSHDIRFETAKGAGYVDQTIKIHLYLNTDRILWLNQPFYYYRSDNSDASDKNFNFKAMLSRWQNIHLLLKNKYADKYASIAPYLIREEYICTILKTQKANIIPNRRYSEILVKNFSFTKNAVIRNSPVLPETWKRNLITLKQNKENLGSIFSKANDNAQNFKFYLFNRIPLFSYKKTSTKSKIRLFNFLPLLTLNKKTSATSAKLLNFIPLIKIVKR